MHKLYKTAFFFFFIKNKKKEITIIRKKKPYLRPYELQSKIRISIRYSSKYLFERFEKEKLETKLTQ